MSGPAVGEVWLICSLQQGNGTAAETCAPGGGEQAAAAACPRGNGSGAAPRARRCPPGDGFEPGGAAPGHPIDAISGAGYTNTFHQPEPPPPGNTFPRSRSMPSYNPKVIEPRWQQFWEANKTFRTPDVSDRPKFYILDMFPYPSGSGLHVGHPEGYTATDILARYRRMRGFHVLHPMGWDAFGLPAEQDAIETGTHPRTTTQKNIDTFRRQIKMLGFSYDWDREVDTTDPNYFKWTQWIFLLLFDTWYDAEQKRGRPIGELPIPKVVRAQVETAVRRYRDSRRLAYQTEAPVNWCPELGTVLANEEVIDGKSERGGYPVVRMPLRQWLLRITDYAERLLADLDQVQWPDAIKKMQRD